MEEKLPTSGISLHYLSREILQRKVGDETAAQILKRFASEAGVRHVFYYCLRTGNNALPIGFGTFPEEWIRVYEQRGYRVYDPIIERTLRSRVPCVWREMTGLSEPQMLLMEETYRVLGRHGVTIPLGTEQCPLGVVITYDGDDASWRGRLPSLIWNGSIMGEQIHSMVHAGKKPTDDGAPLTQRQIDCLCFTANGMHPADIAEVTDMTESAVRRLLDSAQRRLQANSHPQAVAKAVILGYLNT